MNITAIKTQVKREGRYSIFVDGQYAFSLSAEALLDARLVPGQELSQVEVTEYKRLSREDKAYNLALAYVARRMRSEGELHDYFRRKQYAPELAEQILEKLRRLNFVDDAEFAQRWVENRRRLKATSTKKLRLELRQKKVSSDIIQHILEEDETDERQLLRELVEKKRKISRYQDDQKLMMYLARQGFNYDDIKAVIGE
ncbi:RecX family transcriptional regulator [Candidatus Saccharibacteria bacterium]|nr:MAG: RecX family transcriptional regulator [Candidatus Saccharibacteria bacterium]